MLQYYEPFYSTKQNAWCPGVSPNVLDKAKFYELMSRKDVEELTKSYRNGDATAKRRLPAVTWCGWTKGKRAAAEMIPTQMYICDIDHCEEARKAAHDIYKDHIVEDECKIMLVHITPSGKGIRIVAEAQPGLKTLAENMEWLRAKLNLDSYGDFDTAVKDLSRLSFVVPASEIMYVSDRLFEEHNGDIMTNPTVSVSAQQTSKNVKPASELEKYKEEFGGIEYRGTPVKDIVKKYIEVYGEPQEGERHNYYNNLVKLYRHICDNDPRKVYAVLPRFTETEEMCFSQCQSICKTNTLSKLPKDFYFFLKDNGFYKTKYASSTALDEYMQQEETEDDDPMPTPPPVFRELLRIAPKDFVFPAMQALLPIMGTLTSHLRTTYWLDQREHSTEFFTVIFAGSGMGKGFVERYIDLLLRDLQLRDIISNERENLYNRIVAKNKKNDKDPDNPRVTLRIIEPKCSEADFLEKQQSNKGHHMFTFAAEMDQWRKGVRAAGGNKDDMLRIAWDNGFYGQNFKSVNTFKGRVRIYWNVLITGTKPQLDKYFQNVENGLVGRCGFAEVKNQEFAMPADWKTLTKRDMAVIDKWLAKMDAANYKSPLDAQYVELCHTVQEDEFDNEIPWRYEFLPFKNVDMTWLRKTIDKFLNDERKKASLDRDYARDSFRRRSAVRGLRLGLLCTSCYAKITKTEQKTISNFVGWFMRHDIKETISLWSDQYNSLCNDVTPKISRGGLYQQLPDEFDKIELMTAMKKCGIKSPINQVVYCWKQIKAIEKIAKDKYKKTLKIEKQ